MISLSCVCVECGWFKFLVFYLFSCASSSFSAIYRSRYHLFFLDNVHSHRSRPPPCSVVSGGWFISKSGSIPSGYSTERSRSLSLFLDFQNFGRKRGKKNPNLFSQSILQHLVIVPFVRDVSRCKVSTDGKRRISALSLLDGKVERAAFNGRYQSADAQRPQQPRSHNWRGESLCTARDYTLVIGR